MLESSLTAPAVVARLIRLVTGRAVPIDPLGETRALVFTVASLATLVTLAFYAGFFALYERPLDALVMSLLVPATVLNMWFCRRTGALVPALYLLVGAMFAVIGYLVWREGGAGPTIWWLAVPAYTFINAALYRAGAIAFAAAVALQVGIHLLTRHGVALPGNLGTDPALLSLTSRVGFFVTILLTLAIIDRLRFRSLRKLSETNAALQEANRLARSAVDAKSRFLATMSHEIRTPLNGMLGAAELLQRSALTPAQRNFVDIFHQSGRHLMVLVNDVLDFSKLEAGRLTLERAPFVLRELVETVAETHAPAAHAKGLVMSAYVSPDAPLKVIGDVSRLRQVLSNLLSNAVKFTARGDVSLEIERLETSSSRRTELRFHVRDTGIGIDPGQAAQLFQAFRQADDSTTRLYGGTGLGLTISGDLVRLMGSRIEVSSLPGQGACFSFTLLLDIDATTDDVPRLDAPWRLAVVDASVPARRALSATALAVGAQVIEPCPGASPAPDRLLVTARAVADPASREVLAAWPEIPRIYVRTLDDSAQPAFDAVAILSEPVRSRALVELLANRAAAGPSPDATRPRAGRTAMRVLLVEDNQVNQLVALAMLEETGCIVDTAADGAEALACWARGSYDLVLMDCQMPVLDGFEATRRLRTREEDEARERTRIVALTANAFAEDRARCLEAGMDDFLAKPFTREQLVAVLQAPAPSAPPRSPAEAADAA
ncbi:MAG: response regulator [Gammaproteobacteria bacterium]